MTLYDVFDQAYELIKDPRYWTTGASARDKHGNPVHPNLSSACQWCASGALLRASTRYDGEKDPSALLSEIADETYDKSVPVVNDHLGHKPALHILDLARRRYRNV